MLKQIRVLILIFILVPIYTFAQQSSLMEYKGEIGANIGTTTYFGQIGGETHSYSANFGFYFRKITADHIGVRINYEYVPLGANDSLSNNTTIKQRGFQFFRPFHELGFSIEYFLKNQQIKYNLIKFNPYVGVGMSYILNLPNDFNNFKTYNLLLDKYKDQFIPIVAFPINIGFQYPIKKDISLYSELTYRYTTSDVIDNFGSSDPITTINGTYIAAKNGNDKYMSFKIGISKILNFRY